VAQKSNGSIHDCNANLLNLETHSALVPHQCLSYFGNTDYIRNLRPEKIETIYMEIFNHG